MKKARQGHLYETNEDGGMYSYIILMRPSLYGRDKLPDKNEIPDTLIHDSLKYKEAIRVVEHAAYRDMVEALKSVEHEVPDFVWTKVEQTLSKWGEIDE